MLTVVGNHSDSRQGVAVTELAVCLPILVLLVFATLEACHTIYLRQSLSIAAYQGARTALIVGATESNVVAQCDQVLADRKVSGGVVRIAPAGFENSPPRTFIAVEVSAPHLDNQLLPVRLFAKPFMTGRVEMMKEF
jgi:hypothetical protein